MAMSAEVASGISRNDAKSEETTSNGQANTTCVYQPKSLAASCVNAMALHLHLFDCVENLPAQIAHGVLKSFQNVLSHRHSRVTDGNVASYVELLHMHVVKERERESYETTHFCKNGGTASGASDMDMHFDHHNRDEDLDAHAFEYDIAPIPDLDDVVLQDHDLWMTENVMGKAARFTGEITVLNLALMN